MSEWPLIELLALVVLGVILLGAALTFVFARAVARAWARIQYRNVVRERHGRRYIMADWRLAPGMPLEDYVQMLATARENPDNVPGMIALWRLAALAVGGLAIALLAFLLLRCPCPVTG
jgi:hypothetical protein